ncbi:membrane protease YdiL (CAAX protease family) [Galbitalea soli]|nr:membrane protease YdiL (CAAX protease family) [Galbitalea soli]
MPPSPPPLPRETAAPAPSAPSGRGRIRAEIAIVLGLSLGTSAVAAIVQLIDLSTRSAPLGHQSAALNTSDSTRPVFDLLYQLIDLGAQLVPVALVCFLLWRATAPHLGALGIDARRPVRDAALGILLALVIGIGGIGVYLGGRALGVTVAVSANGLGSYWWTVPVLLLSALRAGLQEEVIVVGYLFARLRRLGVGPWPIIVATSLFRGTYHLYQGWGAFVGNAIMGLIFGTLYQRYGRLLPLIIAHTLIDAAIFVGYSWAAATFPALLR